MATTKILNAVLSVKALEILRLSSSDPVGHSTCGPTHVGVVPGGGVIVVFTTRRI